MAKRGWLLDKSAASRVSDPMIVRQLAELAGTLFSCPIGELEQLYPARSAADYDRRKDDLRASLDLVPAPDDLLDRALELQRDLAHHHGLWHRTPISSSRKPRCITASGSCTLIETSIGSVRCDRRSLGASRRESALSSESRR